MDNWLDRHSVRFTGPVVREDRSKQQNVTVFFHLYNSSFALFRLQQLTGIRQCRIIELFRLPLSRLPHINTIRIKLFTRSCSVLYAARNPCRLLTLNFLSCRNQLRLLSGGYAGFHSI